MIRKIGILTSGGDSPGMNAAIRSVVRSALFENITCIGYYRGYQGLIENDFKQLGLRDVSQRLGLGGTFLKSARSKDFHDKKFRIQALENLKSESVDLLVVIGGNGSIKGASVFSNDFDFPVIGIPASIDNDIAGTDHSIGFDTSLNTIINSIDKIRDTARSHSRLFFIEVMGRDCGNLAIHSGLATGACYIITPELEFHLDDLINRLEEGKSLCKTSSIVVVAEGNKYGNAYKIAEDVGKVYGDYEIKVSILGHLQRGGSPSAVDRVVASRLGMGAIEAIKSQQVNVVVGIINNKISYSSINSGANEDGVTKKEILRINSVISR